MRTSTLFCFVLVCLGCAADPVAPTCASDADCTGTAICTDGRCMPVDDSDASVRDGAQVDAAELVCTEDCGAGDCIDGACCEAARSCEGVCCGGGEVCSFSACVTIGDTCRSEDDCGPSEYCESLLGDSTEVCGGETVTNGNCLPRPPRCADGTTPDPDSPSCIASCSFTPPAAAFDVVELYSWGMYDGDPAEPNLTDIRSSPIVMQMDDDDCDGQITSRDVPEIIVITSPNDQLVPRTGDLVLLTVAGGMLREKTRLTGVAHPWTYPAAGNIDALPGNEIVVCAPTREAVAYQLVSGVLVELWRSAALPSLCSVPQIADLDQDGRPEVVVGGVALAGEDGTTRFTFPTTLGSPILMDVDNDPDHILEVIGSRRIFRLEAGAYVEVASVGVDGGNYSLVADLEPGGNPEIVSIDRAEHTLSVWRYDATAGAVVLRRDVDINGTLNPNDCPSGSNGRTMGGGPPTAADVNGDGVPDIAVAGGVGYAVFDGAALVDPSVANADTFLWVARTIDCSSARTGSSVFDFNGDGRAEVLYADEQMFRIYEGQGDGAGGANVLFETCNTNGTLLETPIVADVDSDGQADIIVVSNARYRSCIADPSQRESGVRVFGSAAGTWVRTRSVWNQHDYHITNVEEAGAIPPQEPPNYLEAGLNNYRTNRQPGNQFAATDAVISLAPACSTTPALLATVRNLGEALLPRGTVVTLFEGTPSAPGALLGTESTTLALYPAQAEVLRFEVTDPRIENGDAPIFAQVTPPVSAPECRTDNNIATELVRTCLQ